MAALKRNRFEGRRLCRLLWKWTENMEISYWTVAAWNISILMLTNTNTLQEYPFLVQCPPICREVTVTNVYREA